MHRAALGEISVGSHPKLCAAGCCDGRPMPLSATLIAFGIALAGVLTIVNAVVVEKVPWQFATRISAFACAGAIVVGRLVGLMLNLLNPAGAVWPQGAEWIIPWYGFRA